MKKISDRNCAKYIKTELTKSGIFLRLPAITATELLQPHTADGVYIPIRSLARHVRRCVADHLHSFRKK